MLRDRICDPCGTGQHSGCTDAPVARDGEGFAIQRAGLTDCRCLCDPKFCAVREALDEAREALESAQPGQARKALARADLLLAGGP